MKLRIRRDRLGSRTIARCINLFILTFAELQVPVGIT